MKRLHHPTIRRLLLLTALTAGCRPGGPPSESAEDPPQPEGRLVIVGGALAEDNAPVYHAVLEARDGPGPLCVVPTASGVPAESMATAIERFTRYAAGPRYQDDRPDVVGLWITTDNPEAASDPAVVARIGECSGYWFVGGSQSRIVRTFRPPTGDTPGYEALMGRWRDGAVVAGTSAGAAMMSSRSIAGGSPADALEFGVTTDEDGDGEPDGEGVWIMPGMDFVPWAILGQHHFARGRWGRLVVAALEESTSLGIGIDENTAIVYEEGIAEVIGESGVLVVDASTATRGDTPRDASGVRLELLGPGDRLEVPTRTVTRTGDASIPPPPFPVESVEADPFDRWVFLQLVQAFGSGAVEELQLDGGARVLRLRTGDGFHARALPEDAGVLDEAGTRRGLSAGPLLLDITTPGG